MDERTCGILVKHCLNPICVCHPVINMSTAGFPNVTCGESTATVLNSLFKIRTEHSQSSFSVTVAGPVFIYHISEGLRVLI